jgi:Cu+-exporting ATPase
MTCAACAARIEKSLNRLPGISANVNLATERAQVRAAPDTTAAQLIEAVERAGYGAELITDSDPSVERARRQQQYRRERFWFWISAALSLPLLVQMAAMFGYGHGDLLSRWQLPCNSGSGGASTQAHGTHCAAARRIWMC